MVFFMTSVNIFGYTLESDSLNNPKYIRVGETYGYLLAQDTFLNLIKKEYPQFEMNVLVSKTLFDKTFGKSKLKIQEYLEENLGRNGFKEYNSKIESELEKMLANQLLTEDIASSFILEVESRAKGNIASTVLETLLSFQFSDAPQDELLYGFTQTFKTKGHLKSKNTDWQIKIPKSWKAEEADRPNIIQKFTSDFGSGKQSIMLMVKDMHFPKGYKVTKAELNRFFSEKEAKDVWVNGGKFISFTKMTFDNNIGGMLEFEINTKRLDVNLKIRMVQFMFIRDNKLYSLQGTVDAVNSESADADLSFEMKKYMPLYKLVANTIVVNSQYK